MRVCNGFTTYILTVVFAALVLSVCACGTAVAMPSDDIFEICSPCTLRAGKAELAPFGSIVDLSERSEPLADGRPEDENPAAVLMDRASFSGAGAFLLREKSRLKRNLLPESAFSLRNSADGSDVSPRTGKAAAPLISGLTPNDSAKTAFKRE